MISEMGREPAEHTLEFLLDFDGRTHWYAGGYRVRFEIRRVKKTKARPHGLRYSFTLHDPSGARLIGSTTLTACGHVARGSSKHPTLLTTGTGPRMMKAAV